MECTGRAAVDPAGLSNAINQPRSFTVTAVLVLTDFPPLANFIALTNFIALANFLALADALSDTITKAVAHSQIFPKTQTLSDAGA